MGQFDTPSSKDDLDKLRELFGADPSGPDEPHEESPDAAPQEDAAPDAQPVPPTPAADTGEEATYGHIRPVISGDPSDADDDPEELPRAAPNPSVAAGFDPDTLADIRRIAADNPDAFQEFLDSQGYGLDARTEEDAGAADEQPDNRATMGWRGVLARLGFPMTKGPKEVRADTVAYAEEFVRSELATPLVIGVSSFKGGCGKTSVAVVLARLIAQLRGDDVAVVDTDLHGTLLARAAAAGHGREAASSATVRSLAAAVRDGGRTDVRRHARDAGGGVYVLPGNDLYKTAAVSADEYETAIRAVRAEFPVVIVDMSVVQDGDVFGSVLRQLDGLVVVSPPNEDSAGFMYLTNATLRKNGCEKLKDRRITLINHTADRESLVDTHEFADALKLQDDTDVAEIPFDRHLGMSSFVSMDNLSRESREEFTFATAALVETLR